MNIKFMLNQFKIIFPMVASLAILSSCHIDKRERNIQYMPDMYEAVPYEPYAEVPDSLFSNGMEARLPVEGTIKRGYIPYELKNTNEDYESSKSNVSPLAKTKENLDRGKYLYGIYCVNCHGKKGDGQGNFSTTEKILGIPSYKDRDITEGSIYHVIVHGKGIMGSHAVQLTPKERWQVTQYVLELKNN